MALGQAEPEQPPHHRGEVHPVVPGKPTRQLGVVQRRRAHPNLGQARQVLIGGVQDPQVGAEHIGDRPQRLDRVAAAADRIQ